MHKKSFTADANLHQPESSDLTGLNKMHQKARPFGSHKLHCS